MLYKGNRPQAFNINPPSLTGGGGSLRGTGIRANEAKSFAAAGNKLFKGNGKFVKNLASKVRKHAGR